MDWWFAIKRTLCQISEFDPWAGGGLENVVRYLVDAIRDEYEVTVAFRERGELEVPDGIDTLRSPHLAIPVVGDLVHSFVSGWKVWWGTYDLVHAHAKTGFGYAVFRRIFGDDAKFVTTFHGTPKFLDSYETRGWKRWLLPAVKRLFAYMVDVTAAESDVVVAVSSQVRDELVRDFGVDPSKTFVINNGVDTDRFKPRDRDEAIERLGLDPTKRYLLYVGGDVERKGFEAFVEVFGRLSETFDDLSALAIGVPPEHGMTRMTTIDRLAEDEFPWLYGAADVFIHPSRYEGHPLTVLEAMASGVPVIASPESNVEEVPRGEAYLEAQNVDEFVEYLTNVLSDPEYRSSLADVGRRAMVENLHLSRMIQEYLALYRGGWTSTQKFSTSEEESGAADKDSTHDQ